MFDAWREIVGVLVAVALVVGFAYEVVHLSDASDARYYNEIDRANTICAPFTTRRIENHQDFLTVHCADGSLKVITLR